MLRAAASIADGHPGDIGNPDRHALTMLLAAIAQAATTTVRSSSALDGVA